MVPERVLQAFKGGKQPTAIPGYDNYESQQQAACHNDPGGVIVVYIAV